MNRMNNRTPRLAAFGLMLVAIAACTKTDIKPNDDLANGLNPSSGAPIAFETKDAFSKAVIEDIYDLQQDGNKFLVWSWFQGTTAGPMFTDKGTEVKYGQTTGWTYEQTRYWLNGTYDFAAVYPSTVSGEYKPAQTGGTPVLTVKDFDVTNQDDLLVAFNNGPDGNGIDGSLGNANNPVELKFQHALTRINFKITQSSEDAENDYYVTGVELTGVVKKRTYTVTPSIIETGAGNEIILNGAWTPSKEGNEETAAFENSFDPVHLRSDDGEFTHVYGWGDDGLLLIPQEIEGQISIRVFYRYDLLGDADGNGTATYSDFVIPNYTNYQWQAGKRITYIIPLAHQMDIVIGAPTIEPWTDPQPGGTVIIK